MGERACNGIHGNTGYYGSLANGVIHSTAKMMIDLEDDRDKQIAVPEWMMQHKFYGQMKHLAYPIHTGQVNIPGLTKGSRIVSMKVPPLFHPDSDLGGDYNLLDWIDDIKDWCVICEVEPFKQGKLVQLAIDGTSKVIGKRLNDDRLVHGEFQDWDDGEGRLHRTGVELVIRVALAIYPPNPQVIQLQAIWGWRRFRRKEGETTQCMLARLKNVMFKATTDGEYPIPQIQIAERLVELFQLQGEEYAKYMRPFGGNLPYTPQGVALLESELNRDWTLKESNKPGAAVTPLTVINRNHGRSAHLVASMIADRPADHIPTMRLPSAYPIHFTAQPGMKQPMPLTGTTAAASAYPAHVPPPPAPYGAGDVPYPDFDDDDDMSWESDSIVSSDDEAWYYEEMNDPTPSNIIDVARELGVQVDSNPTEQQADLVIRTAFYQMRRSWRTFRKAVGRPFSRKRGRQAKHDHKRGERRGSRPGGQFQRRRRGHYVPHGRKKYWVDYESVPEEAVEAYFGRGGKSGRKNPKGRDGQPLKCWGCGADDHLEKACPNKSATHFAAPNSPMSNVVFPGAPPQAVVFGSPALVQMAAPFHGAVRTSGVGPNADTSSHAVEVVEEDPTIRHGLDPQFQLVLRRHGLIATNFNEMDGNFTQHSTMLDNLDYDDSQPIVAHMYASPALQWKAKKPQPEPDLEQGAGRVLDQKIAAVSSRILGEEYRAQPINWEIPLFTMQPTRAPASAESTTTASSSKAKSSPQPSPRRPTVTIVEPEEAIVADDERLHDRAAQEKPEKAVESPPPVKEFKGPTDPWTNETKKDPWNNDQDPWVNDFHSASSGSQPKRTRSSTTRSKSAEPTHTTRAADGTKCSPNVVSWFQPAPHAVMPRCHPPIPPLQPVGRAEVPQRQVTPPQGKKVLPPNFVEMSQLHERAREATQGPVSVAAQAMAAAAQMAQDRANFWAERGTFTGLEEMHQKLLAAAESRVSSLDAATKSQCMRQFTALSATYATHRTQEHVKAGSNPFVAGTTAREDLDVALYQARNGVGPLKEHRNLLVTCQCLSILAQPGLIGEVIAEDWAKHMVKGTNPSPREMPNVPKEDRPVPQGPPLGGTDDIQAPPTPPTATPAGGEDGRPVPRDQNQPKDHPVCSVFSQGDMPRRPPFGNGGGGNSGGSGDHTLHPSVGAQPRQVVNAETQTDPVYVAHISHEYLAQVGFNYLQRQEQEQAEFRAAAEAELQGMLNCRRLPPPVQMLAESAQPFRSQPSAVPRNVWPRRTHAAPVQTTYDDHPALNQEVVDAATEPSPWDQEHVDDFEIPSKPDNDYMRRQEHNLAAAASSGSLTAKQISSICKMDPLPGSRGKGVGKDKGKREDNSDAGWSGYDERMHKAPGESERAKAIRDRVSCVVGVKRLVDKARSGQLGLNQGAQPLNLDRQREVQHEFIESSIEERIQASSYAARTRDQLDHLDHSRIPSGTVMPAGGIKTVQLPHMDRTAAEGIGDEENRQDEFRQPPAYAHAGSRVEHPAEDDPRPRTGQISRLPDTHALTSQYRYPSMTFEASSLMLYAPGPTAPPRRRTADEIEAQNQSFLQDFVTGRPPSLANFGIGGSRDQSGSRQAYVSIAELLLAEHEQFLAGTTTNVTQFTQGLADYLQNRAHSFLAAVRLDDEIGESLLIDTGAYDGLGGDEWFDAHEERVNHHDLGHLITEKPTSIMVSGVGKDAERCTSIRKVPGVLSDGTLMYYEAPKIPKSSVPALCGMQTLDEQNMGVLPWSSQLVKVPRGKEKEIVWPQGTTFLQCKRAKTGHMMLPIGHFDKLKSTKPEKNSHLAFTANYLLEQQQAMMDEYAKGLVSPGLSIPRYTHAPSVHSVSTGH